MPSYRHVALRTRRYTGINNSKEKKRGGNRFKKSIPFNFKEINKVTYFSSDWERRTAGGFFTKPSHNCNLKLKYYLNNFYY